MGSQAAALHMHVPIVKFSVKHSTSYCHGVVVVVVVVAVAACVSGFYSLAQQSVFVFSFMFSGPIHNPFPLIFSLSVSLKQSEETLRVEFLLVFFQLV